MSTKGGGEGAAPPTNSIPSKSINVKNWRIRELANVGGTAPSPYQSLAKGERKPNVGEELHEPEGCGEGAATPTQAAKRSYASERRKH